MPRPLRRDHPGLLHHVMNRAAGHRPLFDSHRDVNHLLGLLSEEVEDGRLRVHAYSVLATHFHLLVESTAHGLPRAMQRVEDLFARWFNRTRERDGHVFKSRYRSKPVEDVAYLAQVVAYIDRNPCAAGIVSSPGAYPHGSARHYLAGTGPLWLARDRVIGLLGRITRRPYLPRDYVALWRYAAPPGDALVEAALARPTVEVAPIDVLVRSGPAGVQAWMRECAAREGGESAPRLLLGPDAADGLRRALHAAAGLGEGQRDDPRRRRRSAALAGVLRNVCGLRGSEIAARLALPLAGVYRLLARHAELLRADEGYAAAVAAVVSAAVQRAYGGRTD